MIDQNQGIEPLNYSKEDRVTFLKLTQWKKIFSFFTTVAVIVASLSMFGLAAPKLEEARLTPNDTCA